MKLIGMTFISAPRIPGIRAGDLSSLRLDNVPSPLVGWNIIVRGGAVLFVSAPGWLPRNATLPFQRDPKGPVQIHEIPRANVCLEWEAATAADIIEPKGGKYETGPIGIKPVAVDERVSILSQVPAGQMGDA